MTTEIVTLGIDVSDRYSSYCLLDAHGVVLEEGKLRTSEAGLAARFKDFSGRVVLEAGTHSPWISRVFAGLGNEVIVANPRRVRLIAQSTRRNDKADAQTLARLGRIDPKLLTPITHRKCTGASRPGVHPEPQRSGVGANGAYQSRPRLREVGWRSDRSAMRTAFIAGLRSTFLPL